MSDSMAWTPLADGEYKSETMDIVVIDEGERIEQVTRRTNKYDTISTVKMINGYRLCRATPAPVPQPVEMPDGVRRTIQGLLEAACSGRESVIRTRKDFGLHFRDAQLVLAEYHAALAWLDQQRPGEGG